MIFIFCFACFLLFKFLFFSKIIQSVWIQVECFVEPDLVSNYLQRFSAHLAVNELSVAVIGEQKHHIICFYNTGIDFVVFVVCFFFKINI